MSDNIGADLQELVANLTPHLIELRRRLLVVLVAVLAGVVIGFTFAEPLLNVLAKPVGGIENLQAIELTESVSVYMRVALMVGGVLAMPVIVYEVVAFVVPGLLPHERRMLYLALPFIFLSFIAGAAFAYFVMLPVAIPFLANFGGIPGNFRVSSYVGFITRVVFWVGVAFETPLVIALLARIGVITPQQLVHAWRFAVVGIAVAAALITPTPDPFNMAIVMLPLLALYGLSIVLAHIMYRQRQPAGDSEPAALPANQQS